MTEAAGAAVAAGLATMAAAAAAVGWVTEAAEAVEAGAGFAMAAVGLAMAAAAAAVGWVTEAAGAVEGVGSAMAAAAAVDWVTEAGAAAEEAGSAATAAAAEEEEAVVRPAQLLVRAGVWRFLPSGEGARLLLPLPGRLCFCPDPRAPHLARLALKYTANCRTAVPIGPASTDMQTQTKQLMPDFMGR